jgi:pyridoxal phosphate enzyme (YggS family)
VSFDEVMGRVAAAAERVGRDPADVTVVAVSKEKSIAEIGAVYEHGHRDFGENRAQELADKADQLPKDIRWHFVGSLQSNKARLVRPIASLLHSMDRRSLAKAWLKGMGDPPPVLVQVDVGDEPQKGGTPVAETPGLIEYLVASGLDVTGLMAIPPLPRHPEDSRPHFAVLRGLRDRLVGTWPGVTGLSMGMSDDYEVAIEEGASIIRVGRAIFGPRN